MSYGGNRPYWVGIPTPLNTQGWNTALIPRQFHSLNIFDFLKKSKNNFHNHKYLFYN